VPLISFEAASNDSIPKFNQQTKAVLIHSLVEDNMRPYIALTVQGDPEVLTISDADIKSLGREDGNDFVQSKVLIHTRTEALIPDIATLVSYTSQYF
jgi:hypothetical protein